MMTTALIVLLAIAVVFYGIGTIGGLVASNRAMSKVMQMMDKTTTMMERMIETIDE